MNKTTLTIESQHSYEGLTKNIESTELCIKGYKYEGDFILAFNMNVDLFYDELDFEGIHAIPEEEKV